LSLFVLASDCPSLAHSCNLELAHRRQVLCIPPYHVRVSLSSLIRTWPDSITMHRYLGSEFPRILAKENVEYRQANLTVPGLSTSFLLPSFSLTSPMLLPAIVSSAFDPPAGQDPYSLVFDLTGEVAHDRPEKVRLSIVFVSDIATCNIPYLVHIQGPNQPYM
jgi:hypothetical protein